MSCNSTKLEQLFAAVLEVSPDTIHADTSPRTHHKWDSLAHIQLVTEIEKKFSVQLSVQEITEMKTFARVQKVLLMRGIDV